MGGSDCDSQSRNVCAQKCKGINTAEVSFVCDFCRQSFTQLSEIFTHFNTHNEKTYSCDICNKTFKSKSLFSVHNERHMEERISGCDTSGRYCNEIDVGLYDKIYNLFECNTCGETFDQKDNLVVHQLNHNRKPNECDICHKTFSRSDSVALHKKMHLENNIFECNICNIMFEGRDSFDIHKSEHSDEKSYVCDCCNKSFKGTYALFLHQKLENGEEPHKCHVCNASFMLRKSLRNHMRQRHGLVDNQVVSTRDISDTCEGKTEDRKGPVYEVQYTRDTMKTQTNEVTDNTGNAFASPAIVIDGAEANEECLYVDNVCSVVVIEQDSSTGTGQADPSKTQTMVIIDTQMEEDYVEFSEVNTICESISSQQEVTIYKYLEKGNNKQFQCDICDKCFARHETLMRHKFLHQKERLPVCKVCNKKLSRNDSLQLHMRLHTGARPYVCDFDNCDKSFARRATLVNHRRLHTGERPYLCMICGKTFIQRYALVLHKRKVHMS